jgi:hypothetical protein
MRRSSLIALLVLVASAAIAEARPLDRLRQRIADRRAAHHVVPPASTCTCVGCPGAMPAAAFQFQPMPVPQPMPAPHQSPDLQIGPAILPTPAWSAPVQTCPNGRCPIR